MFGNPISLDVIYYMPIPKPIKERSKSIYHGTVPYLESLNKFFLDAIRDIIIVDDRVICSFSAKKVYDKNPRTEIKITEV
jgi:Holliday junction resolvase RusA-like endonuclease